MSSESVNNQFQGYLNFRFFFFFDERKNESAKMYLKDMSLYEYLFSIYLLKRRSDQLFYVYIFFLLTVIDNYIRF